MSIPKKVIAASLFLAVVFPAISSAQTVEDLKAQITALLAQIRELQAQLAQNQVPQKEFCYAFNSNLSVGMQGSEVAALHSALGKEGFSFQKSGDGDLARSYFGEETASLVTGFQEKYRSEILDPIGLRFGTGFVGKGTRAKLNTLYGCGSTGGGGGTTQSAVVVLSPNGGEAWKIGGTYEINWAAKGSIGPNHYFKIKVASLSKPRLSDEGPGDYTASANQRSLSVYIDPTRFAEANDYRVWVTLYDPTSPYEAGAATDSSDAPFSIVGVGVEPPSAIKILSPNGGEVWQRGTSASIAWTNTSNGPVDIYMGSSNLSYCAPTCGLIAYHINPTVGVSKQTYSWTVGNFSNGTPMSAFPDGAYFIRICQIESTNCAESNAFKMVSSPSSANTPPQLGALPSPGALQPGQAATFTWSATDADGDALSWTVNWGDGTGQAGACVIGGFPNSKTGWVFTAAHAWSQVGTYSVSVGVSDCKGGSDKGTLITVNVGSLSANLPPVVSGVSGPTTLKIGQSGTWTVKASDPENGVLSYLVDWGDQTIPAYQAAPLLRTVPSQTATFTHSYSSPGTYAPTFTVTDDKGLTAQTSVSVVVGQIQQPSITVLSPNGGEVWPLGSTQTVRWSYQGLPAWDSTKQTTQLQLWDATGANFIGTFCLRCDASGPSGGSYAWTLGNVIRPNDPITGSPIQPGQYRIRVATQGLGISPLSVYPEDFSDAPFSIVSGGTTQPSILSPNGGEKWLKGQTYQVSWKGGYPTVTDPSRGVALMLVKDDGTTQVGWISFGNPPNGSYAWDPAKARSALGFPYNVNVPDGTYKVRAIDYNDPRGPALAYDLSDAPFSIVSGSTTQSPLSFAATPLGVSSNRSKQPSDNLAFITFGADPAGSVVINNITVTFGGTAPANPNFLSAVTLIDESGNSLGSGNVVSSQCTGANTCSKTFNLGAGTNGQIVTAGTSRSWVLRVDSTKTATAQANISQTLTASINAHADVLWTNGLGSGASSGLGLSPAISVPITLNAVSYVLGT